MTDVINMDVVEELLSLTGEGDPELLVDLIQMYLEDAPHKLNEINAGLADQDWERVERAAHSLKGSAGNLGAIFVQEDCEILQVASRKQELASMTQGVQQLQDHFKDAQAALEKLLEQYS